MRRVRQEREQTRRCELQRGCARYVAFLHPQRAATREEVIGDVPRMRVGWRGQAAAPRLQQRTENGVQRVDTTTAVSCIVEFLCGAIDRFKTFRVRTLTSLVPKNETSRRVRRGGLLDVSVPALPASPDRGRQAARAEPALVSGREMADASASGAESTQHGLFDRPCTACDPRARAPAVRMLSLASFGNSVAVDRYLRSYNTQHTADVWLGGPCFLLQTMHACNFQIGPVPSLSLRSRPLARQPTLRTCRRLAAPPARHAQTTPTSHGHSITALAR